MITRNELLQLLPPYMGKKVMKVEEQKTDDIINEITQAHKYFAGDYDKISSLFWKGSVVETAREIFNFLKRNVKYSIEPDYHQSVKSPAAILATGIYENGLNDCKHYSLFAAGILDSLKRHGKNINWCYRFANYRIFNTDPGHVFVVLNVNGNEIWLDPVLKTFNNKKSYINKIDKKISMPLYQISGAGVGKRKRNPDGTKKISKLKKIFLKVSAAPSRAAFLALVALNVKKMATKLYQKSLTPDGERKLKNTWENLGGNYQKLKNTFTKAAKRKEKKLAKKKGMSGIGAYYFVDEMGQISGDQVGAIQLAAALAAAVPIIAALAKFLGKGGGEAVEEGSQVIQDIKDNADQVQQQRQQIYQAQPPAYQEQPPQPVPVYTSPYANMQPNYPPAYMYPQPPNYPPDQQYYPPQRFYQAPQATQEDTAAPVQTGIQVRPAVIDGVEVGNYLVTISGIGDEQIVEIKENEPKKKFPFGLLVLVSGGLYLAHKKKII